MSIYLGNRLISGVATPVEPTRNIGQIVQSTLPLNDAGLHLLDGALINGSGIYADFVTAIAELVTDYPDLFTDETTWQSSVTTYGVCGKFVYDSVNNTVRLPKITGFVEGTTDLNALGELIEAGLPNIQGDPTYGDDNSEEVKIKAWNPTGCFVAKAVSNTMNSNSAGGAGNTAIFDASLSNPIYGNSLTVQPQSIKVLYYIVLATSTKTDIEVDIDQVTTDLNGKADVDLSNCTRPYIIETSDPSLWPSWYTVYSNGWCKQGGYLSSGTGTISFIKQMASANYNITLTLVANSAEGQNIYSSKVLTQSMTGFSWYINGVTGYWRVEGHLYGTVTYPDPFPQPE